MSADTLVDNLAGRSLRLVFLCAGLVLLALAAHQTVNTVRLVQTGATADGVVPAADDPTGDPPHGQTTSDCGKLN